MFVFVSVSVGSGIDTAEEEMLSLFLFKTEKLMNDVVDAEVRKLETRIREAKEHFTRGLCSFSVQHRITSTTSLHFTSLRTKRPQRNGIKPNI